MKESEKISYEIDPHNRLVFAKSDETSDVPKFRKVLDGKFTLDNSNTLTYKILKPAAKTSADVSQDRDIPDQIKLSGNFSLDDEHNLVLTLDKWNNQIAGNKLTIKGELLDARDNELAISITTKDIDDQTHIYILKFKGSWQADEYNRLSFNVTKEIGPPLKVRRAGKTDKLTLEGEWEVNKQNQLIYTYTKTYLKTKEKVENTITFKGYWDITEKFRISYVLNKEINSQFDFEVSLGKPDKRGLQYEIGIGAVPINKQITLFGSWKVNKKLGLLFEIPYEEGKIKSIIFGATCKLVDDYNLDFRLENKSGEDLGIDVKLSKKFLKDQGEAFIQALRSKKEISFIAGVGFRW